MQISVVVITKNRRQSLLNTIKSILRQDFFPNELIIIDSSSDSEYLNKALEYLNELFTTTLITGKYSIPQARNIGIAQAKSRFIHFIDDDCKLNPSAYSIFKKHLIEFPYSDVVIGRIVNAQPLNPIACVQHFFYEKWINQNFKKNNAIQTVIESTFFDLENTFLRRKVANRTLIAEDVPFGRSEDIEYGRQLNKKEVEIYFNPNIIAEHSPLQDFSSLIKRGFKIGYSLSYLLNKNEIVNSNRKLSMKTYLRMTLNATSTINIFQKIIFLIVAIIYTVSYRIGKSYFKLHFFFEENNSQ